MNSPASPSDRPPTPMTAPRFAARKGSGKPLTMLTAYDYSMARILDSAGIDSILVGDTLGMVVQGKSTTLPVTVDEIIYHTEIVARAATRAMVIADLPFMSFQASPESAMINAGRILKETGASAVKLEGGVTQAETIQALACAGIPVMGHLGMRPQSVHQFGGMGKIQRDHQRLIADAKAVEEAGAFAVVLELIPRELAKVITDEIAIPTIGIGAGPDCDGQVLVLNDMLGLTEGFRPKFLKQYANIGAQVQQAVASYIAEVQDRTFPGPEHSHQ